MESNSSLQHGIVFGVAALTAVGFYYLSKKQMIGGTKPAVVENTRVAAKPATSDAAGSRKHVVFHITGFGRYAGIENNPTSILMKKLPTHLRDHPLRYSAEVASFTVLETSGVGSLFGLADRLQKNKAMNWKENDVKVVWLHFGLNSSIESFALERVAWNEADFTHPDERGWNPRAQIIIPDYQTTAHCLGTTLPVENLRDRLQAKKFSVETSDNPGRFVCNWLYFHSLHFATMNSSSDVSLFVHVPPFSEVSKEKQLDFARELIDELTDIVQGMEF
eukprot:TRINITY_DN548_c0_g1_i1.p1 TRINITY_DN548_c0_g1~~TRINITY_DN548_c0_g1_i1.p1  ORF type:complete len:277 (-),score=52.49 TRINITY_DN548_c0_g1_i1:20-850(-)